MSRLSQAGKLNSRYMFVCNFTYPVYVYMCICMYVLVRYTKHQGFNQFFWLSTLNSIGCMSGNPLRKKSGCNRLSNLFCKI